MKGMIRAVGRGSHLNPANRFERFRRVDDFDSFESTVSSLGELKVIDGPKTEFIDDHAKSVVSENRSPDIEFRYSLNPYRGCEHGCAYCYARPFHEFLGLNAGLDFETKILVKREAPRLFRAFLARKSYVPEPITFSGVTDCYQPCERTYGLTRACLEIALEARQPINIITKNALILRDLDLLSAMAKLKLITVSISVTSLRNDLVRKLEPRTSSPDSRLKAIRTLSAARVPVRGTIAPLIPGLNDSEIPAILSTLSQAGARSTGYTLLRLPGSVADVFFEWLNRELPGSARKIESAIRETRGGRINDSRFMSRMRGVGRAAEGIERMFRLFCRRFDLASEPPPLDCSKFRRPRPIDDQPLLFD